MQPIYDFFIDTGKAWGIWDFFQKIGPWGTFFLLLAAELVIIGLAILVFKLILKIPNDAARAIIFIVLFAIFAFGVFILVNLEIQTLNKLGGLI